MSQTILIVDDCTPIATIIAGHLKSAGYRPLTADSALAARRALATATPDCIVLDIMMPGMSGSELLHQIRQDPATRNIPVVLVSARVGFCGTHFRSQLDADFSVGKPFTRQQILSAVRTVMTRRSKTPTAALPSRDADDLRL
jgi:CheY-like chemotaxis protein